MSHPGRLMKGFLFHGLLRNNPHVNIGVDRISSPIYTLNNQGLGHCSRGNTSPIREKIKGGNWLVVEPTHLKNMRKSNWIMQPQVSRLKEKMVQTTTCRELKYSK